jgi:hypothetical protein
MKLHIPGPVELCIFVAMALICTLVVHLSPQRDTALFACTLPVFVVAALLGLRRNELARLGELVEEGDESEPAA